MANSSSDGSTPINFNYSSSLEDTIVSNSPTEECPLCCKARKIFYCKMCIRNGDFVRSNTLCVERFSEKQLRLLRLKKDRREVEIACEKFLSSKRQIAKLISEISAHRERIKLLRLIIKDTCDNIAKRKIVSSQLISDNQKSKNGMLPIYRDKVYRLKNFVGTTNHEVVSRQIQLMDRQSEIKKITRIRIKELVKYIFPISVVQPSRSPLQKTFDVFSQEDCDTISALNEAATMAYLRGRWVTTDTSGELHHCIVAPTLPGSGDYSSYNDWVAANKDGVPLTNIDAVENNQAHNISAALTYTAQLVNIMAFFLDIRLPYKLCYSEFCSNGLSASKFRKRISRLNLNVLHLCLAQNVHPDLLHPSQTLQNMLHLLDCSDLGRQGPVEVEPTVAQALEDQQRSNLDLPSDESGSEEDSDHLPNEWEAVPHVQCPEMSSGPVINQGFVGGTSVSQTQATSIAGGLVNSAAASLASIWRGWTGNR